MGVHPNKEHVPDAENLGDLYQVRVLGSQELVEGDSPLQGDRGLHNEWTWVENATMPPPNYANSHGGDVHGSGCSP